MSQNFAPGSSFDGWTVSKATVGLVRAFAPVETPPQGAQALVLEKVDGPGGPPAGAVCRTIPTIAGRRYAVSFSGAVSSGGSALIVVKLGAKSASVGPVTAAVPAVFRHYKVTVRAAVANALFCFTASKVKPGAFPIVDGAKVVDLGA